MSILSRERCTRRLRQIFPDDVVDDRVVVWFLDEPDRAFRLETLPEP